MKSSLLPFVFLLTLMSHAIADEPNDHRAEQNDNRSIQRYNSIESNQDDDAPRLFDREPLISLQTQMPHASNAKPYSRPPEKLNKCQKLAISTMPNLCPLDYQPPKPWAEFEFNGQKVYIFPANTAPNHDCGIGTRPVGSVIEMQNRSANRAPSLR